MIASSASVLWTVSTSPSRSSVCPRTPYRATATCWASTSGGMTASLEWYDPATGRHIVTFDDERAARIQAETRAESAEARNREIEEELRRLRDE